MKFAGEQVAAMCGIHKKHKYFAVQEKEKRVIRLALSRGHAGALKVPFCGASFLWAH